MKAFKVFIIFAGGSSWETYTRRIHYEALSNFGKVIILQTPPPFRIRIRNIIKRNNDRHKCRRKRIQKNNIIILPLSFTMPLAIQRELDKIEGVIEKIIIIYTDGSQRLWWEALENSNKCFDLTDAPWLLSSKKWKEKFEKLRDIIWMSSKCKFVFCTSQRLADFASHFNQSVFYLPNTWSEAQHSNKKLPDVFELLREKKIIGYLGSINDWLDLDLIKYIASNICDSKIVLVGPLNGSNAFKKRFSHLLAVTNLMYIRAVSQDQIGSTIDLFNVCIIPYSLDQFKTYVHPNKLYQYLARGKPVVTTSFTPDLTMFSDLIYVTKDYSQFVSMIRTVLNEDSMDLANKRREFAANNSAIERAKQRIAFLQLQ
jgi:hypothetical protein